jgi:sulfane dehydrogenase subunit SoxC
MEENPMAIDDMEKTALLDASATLSRRKFLSVAGAGAAVAVSVPAFAESLADVPPRAVGNPLGPASQRSKYVHLERITEAAPGKLNVDPSLAINAKTPLDKLVGTITPSDMHYERKAI